MTSTATKRAVAKQTTSDFLFDHWRTWVLDDSVCRAMADEMAKAPHVHQESPRIVYLSTPDRDQGVNLAEFKDRVLNLDQIKVVYEHISQARHQISEAARRAVIVRDYLNGAASALNFYPVETTKTYRVSDFAALRSDYMTVARDFCSVWEAYQNAVEALKALKGSGGMARDHKREKSKQPEPQGTASR